MNFTSEFCPAERLYYEQSVCSINNDATNGQSEGNLADVSVIQPPCYRMAEMTNHTYPTVVLMNNTQLLAHLGNQSVGMCSLVLFYALWCPFSMNMAPAFNALGRLFPTVPVIAVNVETQVNLHPTTQVKFGTVAVPNVLVFNGLSALSRYNKSKTDLGSLVHFVSSRMKIPFQGIPKSDPIDSHVITNEDRHGPMPTTYRESTDWLLGICCVLLFYLMHDRLRQNH